MSETPPKPDGTDPRIVAPSEDEETVWVKSSYGGSAKAYHTRRCRNVEQMRSAREVKKSVAEWKGYHECSVCQKDPAPEPDPEPSETVLEPTKAECFTFRKLLLEHGSATAVAEYVEWGTTAINKHARGKCQHDTPHPAVKHGWHEDPEKDDSGVPGSNNTRIHPGTCRSIRRRLLSVDSVPAVAHDLDMTEDTVRRHAKGDCEHVHSNLDALSFGWHKDD